MNFLRLIRYQNLLMLALTQLVFHFGFLKQQSVPLALADWQFALLVLATVCIAAGGYIINNIIDVETDLENKPNQVVVGYGISEAAAYNCYIAFNFIGLGCGYYLSDAVHRPMFIIAFVGVAATLYWYATNFKRTLLIGNILIAGLLAFSVLIVGIFDLVPAITIENRFVMGKLFTMLAVYAAFTFWLNLIREIVKDMEDTKGDYNQGMNTLPIAIGVARTAKIAAVMGIMGVLAVLYFVYDFVFMAQDLLFATGYGVVFLIAPLLLFSIKIWSAARQKEFAKLSGLLKLVLLFGIVSILVLVLNRYYA